MPQPKEVQGHGGLTAEQVKNATLIYQVGIQMGMTRRDILIGLITAMQESRLRNLDYGDRDSLGLFQQRPSQGWGTPQQVTDPVYAARKFFTALKGLGDRRYQMRLTEAAQAVQRSAFPDAYAAHVDLMRRIMPALQRNAGGHPKDMDGRDYDPSRSTPRLPVVDPPDPVQAADVLAYIQEHGSQPLGAPPVVTNSVLGAQYNPALAAAYDLGTAIPLAEDDPAYTLLGPHSLQAVEDFNASDSSFNIPFQKGMDGWRKAVVQAARSAVGTPYTWGGNSLQNGVDCSGLIQQAFLKAGISLPRVSYQQANSGKRVGIGGLRPGDLVAWDNSSRNNGADHIALYIGNGQIIEAPRPGLAVRIRKLGDNEGAWGVRMSR